MSFHRLAVEGQRQTRKCRTEEDQGQSRTGWLGGPQRRWRLSGGLESRHWQSKGRLCLCSAPVQDGPATGQGHPSQPGRWVTYEGHAHSSLSDLQLTSACHLLLPPPQWSLKVAPVQRSGGWHLPWGPGQASLWPLSPLRCQQVSGGATRMGGTGRQTPRRDLRFRVRWPQIWKPDRSPPWTRAPPPPTSPVS